MLTTESVVDIVRCCGLESKIVLIPPSCVSWPRAIVPVHRLCGILRRSLFETNISSSRLIHFQELTL